MSSAAERDARDAATNALVRRLTGAVADLGTRLADAEAARAKDREVLEAVHAFVSRSAWAQFWFTFRRHPLAVLFGVALLVYVLGDVACAFAYRLPLSPFPALGAVP